MKSSAANLMAVVASSSGQAVQRNADGRPESSAAKEDPFAHLLSSSSQVTAGTLRRSAVVGGSLSRGADPGAALAGKSTKREEQREAEVRPRDATPQREAQKARAQETDSRREPPTSDAPEKEHVHAKDASRSHKKDPASGREKTDKETQQSDQSDAAGQADQSDQQQTSPSDTQAETSADQATVSVEKVAGDEAVVLATAVEQGLLLAAQVPVLAVETQGEVPAEQAIATVAPEEIVEEADAGLDLSLDLLSADSTADAVAANAVVASGKGQVEAVNVDAAAVEDDGFAKMLDQIALVASRQQAASVQSDEQAAEVVLAKNLEVQDERKPLAANARANSDLVVQSMVQPRGQANIAAGPTVAPVVAAAVEASSSQGGASNQNSSSNQQNSNAANVNGVSSTASAERTRDSSAPTFSKVLHAQAHTPVEEQVSLRIKTAMRDGVSRITMQLQPAELGRLDIRLDVGADGKAQVMITADSRSTLELLQKDMRGLERALSDAGVSTDAGSMNFNLRGEQQNGGSDTQRFAESYARQQTEAEVEDPTLYVERQVSLTVADGLDITI